MAARVATSVIWLKILLINGAVLGRLTSATVETMKRGCSPWYGLVYVHDSNDRGY